MITMNMTTKREVRITDKHFSLENDILALNINIGDYDITGKQITAVFEPKGIETVPLTAETAEGVTTVSLPIYSSYIAEGVNYIQLCFRWDSTKLEQSGKMMWVVERSLIADDPGVEQQDLMSYYLQQMVLAIAEADRVVDEAGDVRVELDGSTASATAINDTLADPARGTIKLATDANATLNQSIIDAGVAEGALTDPVTGAIVLAEAAEDALTNPTTGAIKLAEEAKGDIEQAILDNEIVTQTEFTAHKEDYTQQIENKIDKKEIIYKGIVPNREIWHPARDLLIYGGQSGLTFLDSTSLNADMQYMGFPGLRFQSSGITQRIQYRKPIDLSMYSHFEIAFHIDDSINDLTHIYLYFRLEGSGNYAVGPVKETLRIELTRTKKPGYRRIVVEKGLFTPNGTFNHSTSWGNISQIELQVRSASGTVDVHVFAVYGVNPTPALSIEFDDGYASVYENAYPIMRRLGLKGNVNVNTGAIDNVDMANPRMNWVQLRELYLQGWSVNNHTHGHINLDTATEEEIRADLSLSRKILKREGFHDGANYLVCPGGNVNYDKWDIYFGYCKYIRTSSPEGLNAVSFPHILLEDKKGNMQTPYTGMSSSITVATAKSYVDEIINRKVFANLNWHQFVDGSPSAGSQYNINDFKEIMEYIASKRDNGELLVLTARELMYQTKGNIVEDYNGKAYLQSTIDGLPYYIDLEIQE